ncbi:MAG: homoserine kinase [Opitutales bacterium]|nr:homoserine kinase [Opitutales bacterium]MCH8540269.1 homoserine kinase [Opitutales bacterium]
MSHSSSFRIPASTSNLGSGFDTLGMALALYNDITVTVGEPGRGEDQENQAFFETVGKAFFDFVGQSFQPFSVKICGAVPRSRGLGSSVTVRAGIFAALDALCETNLSRETIAREVTMLEGHPDNAVASVFGGLTVAKIKSESWALEDYLRFPVSDDLSFVLISPDLEVKTKDSRSVLPASLPFKEVVQSLNSLSYFLGAFLSGEYQKLASVDLSEHIHQPYRLSAIPGGKEALVSAKNNGAWGTWLSGSGSSLVAMVSEEYQKPVKLSMERVFQERGIQAASFLVKADNEGMRPIS